MGDRANVKIEYGSDEASVYLYTHWVGCELPFIVQNALSSKAGRNHWNNPAYLARIVFGAMVKYDIGDETGFGIASYPPDNEHLFIVLRTDQIIRFEDYRGRMLASWTFEEYVALARYTIQAAYNQ